MNVDMLYGKSGKLVELPDDRIHVVRPKEVAPIEDEKSAVFEALRSPIAGPPLRDIISADGTVAIVFSDITRPMLFRSILLPSMDELSIVPDNQIVFY